MTTPITIDYSVIQNNDKITITNNTNLTMEVHKIPVLPKRKYELIISIPKKSFAIMQNHYFDLTAISVRLSKEQL